MSETMNPEVVNPEEITMENIDPRLRAKMEEDLSKLAEEEQTSMPSFMDKVKGFLNSASSGMKATVMTAVESPAMRNFGNTVKQVGIQEAEARLANIIKDQFFSVCENFFGKYQASSKLVNYLFFTKTGRLVTLAVISFPTSAFLHVQAERFREQDDETCAKLCMVLSRVLIRMATEEGVRALDIDNKVRMGLNWMLGVIQKEGINPATLLDSEDANLSELDKLKEQQAKRAAATPPPLFPPRTTGYNKSKKHK